MASGEDCPLLQQRNEDSNEEVLNSGSSAHPNRGLASSYPPILSKDEWHRSEGIGNSKNQVERVLSSSCPQPSSVGRSLGSNNDSKSYEEEQQVSIGYQISEPHHGAESQNSEMVRNSYCDTLKGCYNNYARKIRNSFFIYFFLCFVCLQALAAILLGIIYFNTCDGTYQRIYPILAKILGIFALHLVYRWQVNIAPERAGQRYWNHERDIVEITLIIALVVMILEYIFFTQLAPRSNQISKAINCDKTYYDLLFCLHIANGVSLVLATLLYLPDGVVYISKWKHAEVSASNGLYQPL